MAHTLLLRVRHVLREVAQEPVEPLFVGTRGFKGNFMLVDIETRWTMGDLSQRMATSLAGVSEPYTVMSLLKVPLADVQMWKAASGSLAFSFFAHS